MPGITCQTFILFEASNVFYSLGPPAALTFGTLGSSPSTSLQAYY